MKAKLIIELAVPEREWKKYGDVTRTIEVNGKSKCGGIVTWEDLFKDIKYYFEQLPQEKSLDEMTPMELAHEITSLREKDKEFDKELKDFIRKHTT
ncbi:hypothetical protein LCGC14_2077010 [marine sediment metagenome]|uniref:Uncharacterized protein n=1 Tax=marine sediment metagenome TaxID=412755 RepID=A0A0F9HDN0_9ZZZZ